MHLGATYHRQGKDREAIESLAAVAREHPEHVETHNVLGAAYLGAGLLAEASEHFTRAIELDPENVEARLNLAVAWCREGQYADAVRLLTEVQERLRRAARDEATARRLSSFYVEAVHQTGIAQARQGNWREAETCFRRAVAMYPQDFRYRRSWGHALSALGQQDAAAEQYRAAKAMNPRWLQERNAWPGPWRRLPRSASETVSRPSTWPRQPHKRAIVPTPSSWTRWPRRTPRSGTSMPLSNPRSRPRISLPGPTPNSSRR